MKTFKFCGEPVKKGDIIDLLEETAKIYTSMGLVDYLNKENIKAVDLGDLTPLNKKTKHEENK